MDTQNKNLKVTGTEESDTSVPAGVGELATSIVINSSDNVSWNKETDKYEITDTVKKEMLRKVDYLKGYFEDDKYWPQPPCPNTDENRGKLIKEFDVFHSTIDNLDPCFKVEPEVNLDSVKRIIDSAILDLNSLAVLGLASKKKSIYDHTLKIMYSLVNAQVNLSNIMHTELDEDEQMRTLRSSVNSPIRP